MDDIIDDDVLAFDVQVKYRRIALHRHNVHELFFCCDGAGGQLVADGIEEMVPGDLFFFPAGVPHRGSGAVDRDCIGIVVNVSDRLFSGSGGGEMEFPIMVQALREWVQAHEYRLPLRAGGSEAVLAIAETMVQECQQRQIGYQGALKALVMQLLLGIIRHGAFPAAFMARFKPSDSKSRIDYACAYIRRNYSRGLTVADVLEQVAMSRSHFHAEFLRHVGCTMVDYVNRLRCENAVEMLKEGRVDNRTIAHDCGFGSLCSFYRVLREETGCTPSRFRRTRDFR